METLKVAQPTNRKWDQNKIYINITPISFTQIESKYFIQTIINILYMQNNSFQNNFEHIHQCKTALLLSAEAYEGPY